MGWDQSYVFFFFSFCLSYTSMVGNFCITCEATIADTSDMQRLNLVELWPLILFGRVSIVTTFYWLALLCKQIVSPFCQIEKYLQCWWESVTQATRNKMYFGFVLVKQIAVKIVRVHPHDVKRYECSLVRSNFRMNPCPLSVLFKLNCLTT